MLVFKYPSKKVLKERAENFFANVTMEDGLIKGVK